MPIAELTLTCPSAPTQWEGRTQSGLYIYGRSRHSHGYVTISKEDSFLAKGDYSYNQTDNNKLEYTLNGGVDRHGEPSKYNCCSPNHLHRLIQLYVAMVDAEAT